MITDTQLYMFNLLPDRLRYKIDIVDSGCWVWAGSQNRNGYGRHYWGGITHMTHILVYNLLKGYYKRGLLLDHTCNNRLCCNPTHLSPVTVKVNTHRGKAVLFKRCSSGK